VALAGMGFLAWIALAAAGGLPPALIPIRIDFDAPPACADADAFYAGVLARMNRVRRARPGEGALRLIVRLTRIGGKVHGELHIDAEGGESDTRRVDGATCEEVVQVLSLTAALAIDPSAGVGPAASEKPAPAAAPPSPARPSPTAPMSPPSPAPAAPVPPAPQPPRASPAVESSASPVPPAPGEPVEPAAVVATPALPPPESSPPPAPPRASGWELGAAAVAAEIVSSSVSAGAGISVRVATTTRDGLTPSADLALVFMPTDFVRSGDDIGVRFTALALTGCPGWALRGWVEVEACARGTGGLLIATDHSVNHPRSVDLAWWSAGALLRATTRLGASGFTLELSGGVDLPVVKRRFIVTIPAGSVGQTPTVSPNISWGVTHSL
jgi:hypothetical protein